jgi:hypothetical protein
MAQPERNRGLLFASGTTVPTDGTDGYQTGCIFQQTDGGSGTAVYINEGSVTSCNFNALSGGAAATTLDGLTDITGALSYTAGALLVADADSYEEVSVSGDATLAANGALSLANNCVDSAELVNGAVDVTHIEGLAAGEFIIGVDGTAANNAKVTMSGDATLGATGLLTIAAGAVEDSMIEGLANGEIIVGSDGTPGGNTKVTVTGDITMDSSGVTSWGGADIDLGSSGTAGSVDIFPATASRGKLTISATNSAGDTTTTITNASQAGARTYTIPDAGASASFLMTAGAQTITGKQTIAPTATGTFLDFVLETEWTTGTLINADFASGTTYSGAVVGMALDLGTNIVATSEQNATGVNITLPQSTNDAASPALRGVVIAASGAMTAATSGDPTFTGVEITTPAIDCTLDTITSVGVHVTTGQCTQTGGVSISAAYKGTGGTLTSGSAYGLFLDGNFTTGVAITSTVTTGVAISGTTGTGISIGACSTAAITAIDAIILSPDAAGTLLDFALETEWVSGTLVNADFASGTTFSSAVIGANLDFGTNIVATSEQSVSGVVVTLPQSTNDAASPTLKGFEVNVSGAMTTATSGTATYVGVDVATPAITQTAGTCSSTGVLVTGGAITSGTATGLNLAGAWTTGLLISGTSTNAISITGAPSSNAISIAGAKGILIAPTGTGTFLDFALETEWTSGSLIRADLGSSTTYAGQVIGVELDLGTNAVATAEQSVTGYKITLPQSTNDAASPNLYGLQVAVSGALTTDTSGTATFRGVTVATPAITQTAGTCRAVGIFTSGGAITSGTSAGVEVTGTYTTAFETENSTAITNLLSVSVANGPAVATVKAGDADSGSIAILVDGATRYLHYWSAAS